MKKANVIAMSWFVLATVLLMVPAAASAQRNVGWQLNPRGFPSDVSVFVDVEEGGAFRRDLPVGMMIETPAAADACRAFVREVDFISIGTNDLVQYMLAVDRANERIASLYSPANPAVIRKVRDIIRTADRANISVSLCGEMSGDPMFTLLLLSLGLRRFSMTPPDVPEIKKMIRSVTIRHARWVARKVLSFESDREVVNYLRDEARKVLPEAL